MPRELERDVASAGTSWLRRRGCACIKLTSYGRYGSVGWPDTLVLAPEGHAWFIEWKAPGKKPTALQAKKHVLLRHLGFPVFVVHSRAELERAWKTVQEECA